VDDIGATVGETPKLSRVAEQLVALRRNSMRLSATKTADEPLGRGVAQLGGLPDLPAGFAWPLREVMARGIPVRVALPFVAQLQMDVLAPCDADRLLPPAGMRDVFSGDELQLSTRGAWSLTATPTNRRIMLYDGDLALLRRAAPPEELPARRRSGACAYVRPRDHLAHRRDRLHRRPRQRGGTGRLDRGRVDRVRRSALPRARIG
jgi:hypothetical protein